MTYGIETRRIAMNCKNLEPRQMAIKDITKIIPVNKSTIYRWAKLNDDQLAPKRKRKEKLKIHMKFYIRDYVIRNINFSYVKLIALINKKYKIIISKSLLYVIIKKFNITRKKIYRKPLYTSATKRKEQIITFKNKIKSINQDDIISIDETSIDTHIGNSYGWSKRGKPIYKIQKEYRIRYTVICAISNKQIIYYKVIKNSANGEDFLNFIKVLRNKLKKSKKYLLMDNARIHHYSAVKEYIKNNKQLECIYNIPYSPEFNPIEQVFSECKRKIKNYKITNKNILQKIKTSFKVNKTNLTAYFNKSLLNIK